MKTIIIAALSKNNVIGRANALPWHYPADMAYFRRTTRGYPVVVGRKTYESFQVRPLPDRLNFVLTRNLDYPVAPGVIVCRNIERVMDKARARGAKKLFIIGGAQIYALALPLVDEMILTRLPIKVEGDAYFPEWDESEWELANRRREGELIFATYRRKGYISSALL